MRRSDPVNNAIPRWLTILVSVLPAGGTGAAILVLGLFGIPIRMFNLSPKDSFLVVFIGAVLIFTVVALLILCLALMRALRQALTASTRSSGREV
jgi:hypothetical protein